MSSISNRLFRDLALPAVLLFLLLAGLAWWGARKLHRYQSESQAVEQIQSAKRRLRAQTQDLETMGAGLAKTWTSLEAQGLDQQAMLHAALPLLRRPTMLTNLLFCTKDGQFLTLIRAGGGWDLLQSHGNGVTYTPAYPLGQITTLSHLSEPNYPFSRPWFTQGMALTKPTWTQPYTFVDGRVDGYSYLVPVFNAAGERIGLICLDIAADRIQWTLQHCLMPLHGQALVASPSGEIIVPPQDEATTFPIQYSDDGLRPNKDIRSHGLLPASWTSGSPFPREMREGAQTFRVDHDALTLADGVEATLWTAIPQQGMHGTLKGITLGFTAFLILVLLAWVLYGMKITRRYGRPITHLLNSAEQARTGQDVVDVDSDIWEIRRVGEQLQMVGKTVRAKRELEDQLVRAQRFEVMSALSGGVVHDLNNLLTSIQLRVERLLEQPTSPARPGDLQQILLTTQHGCLMSRRLLDLGHGEAAVHRLDLNECVAEAALLLQPALHEIQLKVKLADSPQWFMGDPAEVAQVVLNLALNARDAMSRRGVLRLQVGRSEAGWPELSVIDNGPGIPEAVQSRIFDPYFTTKPKGKGTGLGLAVVQRVVERLGGRIQFSSCPESGTHFQVALPPAS
jgi:signal transduction histidine kinase